MKKIKKKKNSAITLMELIIALAIIAIIAGIIALNLFGTTDRARIRSDIQSTIVLRSAVTLYRLGAGRVIGNNIDSLLTSLYDYGYINNPAGSPQIQGAIWVIHNDNIYLNLASMETDMDLYFLNENERSVLIQ
ncbi:MAG: prepilin-type N-terminal cleavage/methylation domain-containing protein [Defluviitaleaceae bacterium]|nr:prepilin-type N-terminal cleavage/methylation domain-containing protein [Defluviitaleaceae bacterium]